MFEREFEAIHTHTQWGPRLLCPHTQTDSSISYTATFWSHFSGAYWTHIEPL